MYLITTVTKKHNDIQQSERGTWCDDYVIYENQDQGSSIELVRYRGGHGVIEEVLEIDRKYTCAFIMNINGKTIRSIPLH